MSNVLSAKKKIGRPRIDSEAVNVRFAREHLVLIDAWRATQPDSPSRPEAIRRLVEMALQRS